MLEWYSFGVHRFPLRCERSKAPIAGQHPTRAVLARLQAGKVHCVRIHVLGTRRQPLQMRRIENLFADVAADKKHENNSIVKMD